MKFQVSFGVLCPPLDEQLRQQGFKLENAQMYDEHSLSISRLKIHGIATDAEVSNMEKRLLKKMQSDIVKIS